MQMLCEGSEEGELEGLASLPGRFERFYGRDELDRPIKVPHMGWNTVSFDLLKAP
jgi:glutamine amidotransferase